MSAPGYYTGACDVFPQLTADNSLEVQRLRSMNLKYAMLYPDKLKVIDGSSTHFFQSPKEAHDWIARGTAQTDKKFQHLQRIFQKNLLYTQSI